MRLEIATTERRLCALEPAWWELWRSAERTTPFQSPAWQIPWFRSFASSSELRAIAVLEGDALLGLLPLTAFTWRGERLAAPLGIGISDYLDVLLCRSPPPGVLALLGEGLSAVLAEVDRLELSDLPGSSPLCALASELGVASVAEHAICPVVDLDADLALYFARLPRWLRRSMQSGKRGIARSGYAWRSAEPPTLDAMLSELFALHAAHWRTRGEPGVLGDRAVQEFHREAAPRLLRAGLLRMFVLDVGSAPAGAVYVLHGSDAYLYASGHAPELHRHGIGNLLIEHALADAHASGKRRCDFLRGTERYKYVWGARDEPTRRITVKGGLS